MKNKICKTVDYIADAVSFFYKLIDKGQIISFSEIGDDYAKTAFSKITLYGIEFVLNSNYFEEENMDFLFQRMKNESDSFVMVNFIKNDYEYGVYVLSNSKDFITSLSLKYGEKNILTGEEIVYTFFKYFNIVNYDIKDNILIDKNETTNRKIIKNLVSHVIFDKSSYSELKNKNVFELNGINFSKTIDPYSFFSSGWKGVLSLFFLFSNDTKKNIFALKTDYAGKSDLDLKSFLIKLKNNVENYNNLIENYCLMNAVFIGDTNSATTLSSQTGLSFFENAFDGNKIYRKTLMLKRNYNFLYFVPLKYVNNFFFTTKKKIFKNEKIGNDWFVPDFWGFDYAKGFLNHCFKKSTNPHTLVVGETGSGKTTAMGKLLKQAFNFDKNYNSSILNNDMGGIRYFDVDFSQGGLMKKIIMANKNKSLFFTRGVKNLRFNILDLEEIMPGKTDEIEKALVVEFISMVFSIMSGEKDELSGSEKGLLLEAIDNVYLRKKEYFINYSLKEIESEGEAYRELIDDLYKKGYKPYDTVLNLDDEYAFLKKPTLKSVLKYVDEQINRTVNTKAKRDTAAKLAEKLRVINNLNVFSFFANKNYFKFYDIFYMDVTELKEVKDLFIAVVWLMMFNLIKIDKKDKLRRDKENLPKRKIYYILEEAHNFLSVQQFSKMFINLAKEVRKYGIELKFLVHKIDNVDPDIYRSVANKIFLFKKGGAKDVLKDIKEKEKIDETGLKLFDITAKTPHGIFFIHSEGIDSFAFEMTQEDLKDIKQEVF